MPPTQLQFDGEPSAGAIDASYNPGGLAGLVIRWGLANDGRSAIYVLIGIAALAVVLAFIIPAVLGTSSSAVPSGELNQYIQTMNASPH